MTSDIQSRLDAIFKRDDIRGIWPEPMSASMCALAAKGFADLLRKDLGEQTPLVIAVGYDARISSSEISECILNALSGLPGCRAVSLGRCSSEELAYACGCHGDEFSGGIMVTASHNPSQYNGMKFVLSGGYALKSEQLASIRTYMAEHYRAFPERNMKQEFAEHLVTLSGIMQEPASPAPVKVVVAAGNGVGVLSFKAIAELLSPLGFEFIYLEGEPDGRFPNGVPNPLLKEYMQRVGECVRLNHAELGIAFDGDADRAGFVDENGQEIIPAQVYAIVALGKLSHRAITSGKPILMRNICCSQLLSDLFRDKATVIDTPVGHGQIKQLMRHQAYAQDVIFAGEHSGHFFYPEFFSFDSGMLTALSFLRYLLNLKARHLSLTSLLAPWREKYCWSGEINRELPSREAVLSTLKSIAEHYSTYPNCQRIEIHADEAINGLQRAFVSQMPYSPDKLRFLDLKFISASEDYSSGWWFVVRPSGNEPKLRLNIEAWGKNCRETTAKLVDELEAMMQ